MSICRRRLIMWLILAGISVVAGIATDLILKTEPFPPVLRLAGLIGMVLAHFPLKKTGKLLKNQGAPVEWGGTTRLITTDIYQCVRHPHHLGVGVFMTSLGLFIGHPGSFLIITISQWIWVIMFLLLVEEKELMEKFGAEYRAYRQNTPLLVPRPACFFRALTKKAGFTPPTQ